MYSYYGFNYAFWYNNITLGFIIVMFFCFVLQLENQIHNVLPKLPAQLQEIAPKMLSKDVDARPFVKNLLHTPYFW